jgi:hypothetical protein
MDRVLGHGFNLSKRREASVSGFLRNPIRYLELREDGALFRIGYPPSGVAVPDVLELAVDVFFRGKPDIMASASSSLISR